MRVLLLILGGVFVGWLLLPGDNSASPSFKPASVSQTRSDIAMLMHAQAAGLLVEDPHRHELRQAAIDAGRRVESAPCDEALKEGLRRALDALVAHLHDTMDKPTETVTVDGRVIDASPVLNEPARVVWQNAAQAGIMREDDGLAASVRAGAPRARLLLQSEGSGPYACRVG